MSVRSSHPASVQDASGWLPCYSDETHALCTAAGPDAYDER